MTKNGKDKPPLLEARRASEVRQEAKVVTDCDRLSALRFTEIDGFFRKSGKVIVPLTVKEILDEQLAKKLA